MRWTCESPFSVFQFFTSSFTSKSPALAVGITRSLVGATNFTVGVGADGSGLAAPCTSCTGGAGGGAGAGAALAVALSVGAALDATGGGAGGGGGGGRFSLPPPHAIARAAGRRGTANKRSLDLVIGRRGSSERGRSASGS